MTPFRNWREAFEQRTARPLPPAAPQDLPHRELLLSSLARFQVGEAGEGRIARQIWKLRALGIDDDYRVALGLLVKEEGRHARILAAQIKTNGGALLRGAYTERAFVAVRRMMGVRYKIVCLCAAEVIGMSYYRAMAEALPEGELSRALAEIAADETLHLSFHAVCFRNAVADSPINRGLFRLAWWSTASAGQALMVWDHRETLRAFGVDPRAVLREGMRLRDRLTDAVLGQASRLPTPDTAAQIAYAEAA